MTVDLPVDEAELELLLFLVDGVLRKRPVKTPHPEAHYRKAAEALFAKLMKASDIVLAALMRAEEKG